MQVVLDRSGIYCATSCTDKTLAIYDYHTGELMASMAGRTCCINNYTVAGSRLRALGVKGLALSLLTQQGRGLPISPHV